MEGNTGPEANFLEMFQRRLFALTPLFLVALAWINNEHINKKKKRDKEIDWLAWRSGSPPGHVKGKLAIFHVFTAWK